jgi:transcriptional regulator with XRE-family HTH domain
MARLATRQRESRINTYLEAVNSLHGPDPTNPFRWLRLNANLTLNELCELTGVSKQAMIRLEQGTYAEPIERVMEFWLTNASRYNQDTDYVELTNKYERYKAVMRKRHSRIFGSMPVLDAFHRRIDKHPFVTLRSLWQNPETQQVLGTMNVTECSKLLCIPQSVLDHFQNKVARQQTVPQPLLEALRDNGYGSDDLSVFSQAYEDHRRWILHHVTPAEHHATKPLDEWAMSFEGTKGGRYV